MADETITTERWAEIERVAAFGTPADTLPSSSALARMVEDLADEVRRMREAQANEPRAIIRHFAAAMERKLAANDGKGTWRNTGTFALLGMMHQEVNEFVDALNTLINLEDDGAPDDILAKARDALLCEGADVANFIIMLCDNLGALPPTDERGW